MLYRSLLLGWLDIDDIEDKSIKIIRNFTSID
jgi:hypothetical protein